MTLRNALSAALVAFAFERAALAACTSGAAILQVPENCSTIGQAVGAVADGGLIDVAAGTYGFGGAGLDFGAGNKSLKVRARSLGAVVFSGGGSGAIGRISGGKPVAFEGIRFLNGYSATANRAGAMTLGSAEATFVDCSFEDNRMVEMTTGGGALGLYGASRALLVRTKFLRNSSSNDGGAIYATPGSLAGASSVWIFNGVFQGNSSGKAGGAIYLRAGKAYVANTRFEANAADFVGGAIYAYGEWTSSSPYCNYAAPTASVLVTRSYFLQNRADDDTDLSRSVDGHTEGGALHSENCARLQLFHSRLEGNESNWGGAISSYRSKTTVADTVFRGNLAFAAPQGNNPSGGAIIILSADGSLSAPDYPAAQLTIDNSLVEGVATGPSAQLGGCLTVNGDLARQSQGGAFNSAWRAKLVIRNTAFSRCAVEQLDGTYASVAGGAIFASLSDATFTNDIILNSWGDGGANANAMGGGAVLATKSTAAISNLVFSGCTSDGPYPDLRVDSTSTTSGTWSAWTTSQTTPAGSTVLAVPSRIPSGSSPFQGQAFLAYAWSGSSATLDGKSLGTPKNGVVAAIEGTHTLAVSGLASKSVALGTPVFPSAVLAASPTTIAPGSSTSLSWSTSAGTFLASLVDQGVGEKAATGSTSLAPSLDTTFRRLTIAAEGGALDAVAIDVTSSGSPPPGGGTSLFSDGFETGSLSGWSIAAP